MKKIIVLNLLIISFVCSSFAQQTLIFTQQDILFNQGKDFYSEHEYAASYRSFEDFLKYAASTDAGQIQEARYYIAANAYELRLKDASDLLTNYVEQYPYTPFLDRVNLMLGMLQFEKKDFTKALSFFNQLKSKHLGDREQVDYMFCKGYA